jgi:hypothetical protein
VPARIRTREIVRRFVHWIGFAGDGFVDSIGDTPNMRMDTRIYTALER